MKTVLPSRRKRSIDDLSLKKFRTLINRSFRYDYGRAGAISQYDHTFDELTQTLFEWNESPRDAAKRILNILEKPVLV